MNQPCRDLQPAARLGLWDTVSLIVGIIVGVGIYITPSEVFANSPGAWEALALWLVAGVLSLVGALCFAELASTYPRSGGEYVYLTRAYGPWMGFLFAWAQLIIIRTGGGLAVVAYLFARYAGKLFDLEPGPGYVVIAVVPIVLLTLVNIGGVTLGKATQNFLTALKVLGLGGILVAGFLWARPDREGIDHVVRQGEVVHVGGGWLVLRDGDQETGAPIARADRLVVKGARSLTDLHGTRVRALIAPAVGGEVVLVRPEPASAFLGLAGALIFVLWTYAGWHEAAYVAAEVRDRRRALPLALLLGTAIVTVLYLLVNLAYLVGLGFDRAAVSSTVAADVLALAVGDWGAWAMSLLIVLSVLGGLNGMTWTSSRIFAEMGRDHPLFAPLGRWHAGLGTPVVALVVQGGLSVAMVVVVGLAANGRDGFEVLVKYTAAPFWLFFLLTGLALLRLRAKDPDLERPFVVPWYPYLPLLFVACCGVMLCGSVSYAPLESLLGLALLATGLPLYWLSRRLEGRRHEEAAAPVTTAARLVGRSEADTAVGRACP